MDGSPCGKFAAVDVTVGYESLSTATHSFDCPPRFESIKATNARGLMWVDTISGIDPECSRLHLAT